MLLFLMLLIRPIYVISALLCQRNDPRPPSPTEELRLERNELDGEVPTEICQLDLKMLTADCANGKLTCTCCTECFT